jgi:YhcH/YjgK/YiaL family protein
MILDTINNIEIYKKINPDIYAGLLFLKNIDPEILLGTYIINGKVKAIVSEYETKEEFIRGYESHKKVIDIQYPIKGVERVKWSPIQGMNINIPYDEVADRTFYKDPLPQGMHVDIGNGIFAIMFTEDGHSPQHFVDKPELIKKVTVKVSI